MAHILLGGLCLALGMVALLLKRRADETVAVTLKSSVAQYRDMVSLRDKATTPQDRRSPPTQTREQPWTDSYTYLSNLQQKVGIAPNQIPEFRPTTGTKTDAWQAHVLAANLTGGLEVGKLAQFVRDAEQDKPFLKCTKLTMLLEEGNKIRSGNLEMTYWLRTQP
jgi:hypothetical protein